MHDFTAKSKIIEQKKKSVTRSCYSGEEFWTKGNATRALAKFVKSLGRAPTVKEVDMRHRTHHDIPTGQVFRKYYGTWSAALVAAGCEPARRYYTDRELIIFLRDFGKKLGRTPRYEDIGEARKTDKTVPCATVFSSHFGSFAGALIAADFEPNQSHRRPNHR